MGEGWHASTVHSPLSARRAAAVAFFPHHVEHLAPLCQLFDLPLIATSGRTRGAGAWYPAVAIQPWLGIEEPRFLTELAESLRRYDVLFWSHFFPAAELRAQFTRLRWHPRIVYCPHGYSEKHSSRGNRDAEQDIRLLYRLTPSDHRPRRIVIGDLARWHYETHRAWFDGKAASIMPERRDGHAVVLYTPTYVDQLRRSSLADAAEHVCANVPADVTLVIKPHPLLLEDARSLALLRRAATACARTVVIEQCTLTHPLLARADALITDMSSMAYLFLAYRRPIVLLNQNAGRAGDNSATRLAGCSAVLSPSDYAEVWTTIQRQRELFAARPAAADAGARVYVDVYGDTPDLPMLARELDTALN